MRVPKHATLAARELTERGIKFQVEHGGKHARLVFQLGHGIVRLPISRTSQPDPRSMRHLRADLRGILRGQWRRPDVAVQGAK